MADSHAPHASHTERDSEAAFAAWTKSGAFRSAHRHAGSTGDIHLRPPERKIFASVQHIAAQVD